MFNFRKSQIHNCLAASYFQKQRFIGIVLRTLLVLVCGTGVVSVGQAQSNPSVVGQWSPLMTWPFKSVHTVYFPTTGKVFFWPSFEMGDNPTLYDPVTGATAPTTLAGYNFFCAGLSLLPDGRLFVTGGDLVTGSGVPNASIYDPVTAAWTFLPAMNEGRWYPTNTTLGNGDVLVTSGTVNPTVGNDPLPQVFKLTSNSWRDLSTALLVQPTYPEMYLLPDGTIFNPGPEQQSRFLNTTGTGGWTLGPLNNYGYRDYGPAVMYDTNKFLLAGGGNPPTTTVETIDLTVQNPTFQYASPMTYPRRQSNATILADGTVLVTGGSCGPGFDNASCPVYPAERWNPTTGTWTVMASLSVYRGYHSTAILMPDGSVLSGGGNASSAEIYYPPYFFAGPRPTITSAPATVDPGETFFVATPDHASITAVNLIRLSATTHTNNMEQRISHLSFTEDAANGGLQITAPATNNIVPPGYYMLFILNNGVPSLASLVHITNAVQAGTPSIALSTKFLNFGAKTAGTTTTLPVTVTNLGNSTLNINSVQIQGTAFSPGTNTCGSTLNPLASCTIKASFQPPTSGPFQGSMILSDSDINSPQVVTLSGRGSALQLSSLALSFGTVAVGGTSATPVKLTLTNLGSTALSLTSFTYSNPQFSQSVAGTTCGASLSGGASCFLASVFSPSSNGSQSGSLTISSSDPGSPSVVTLGGTGGALTFSGGMAFGNEPLTYTGPALTTTLSNLTASDYNVSFTLGGTNPGDFIIVSNPCGTVLHAGTNCVITAKFAPLALGPRTAVLSAAYSQVGGEGGDSNSGTAIANMTGTGIPNVVSLAVTPTNPTIGFGATQQFAAIGTYSDASTKDLTTSVNWASLTTTVATMSGTTKGLATAVGAGASVIRINYLGLFGQTVLTVTGAAANLSPSLPFGNQALLSTSSPLTTTLSNTGIAVLNITNVGLGGANAGDFAIHSNTCGSQLQPNANCTISVTFAPQALGARAATLVVTDNSGAGSQSINLTGTGTPNLTSIAVTPANPSIPSGTNQQFTATGTYSDSSTKDLTATATWASATTSVATMSPTVPGLASGISSGTSSISATSAGITGSTVLTVTGSPGATLTGAMAFGNQVVLTTSGPLVATLTNTSSVTLDITNIGLGGSNPGDFAIPSTTCGSQLLANSNCTISVTFTPQALGARSATLTVTDNAGTGSQSLPLTGAGTPSLTSIAVTPANPSMGVGVSQQFIATGTYSDTSTHDLTASSAWSSSNPSVAAMSGITPGLANTLTGGQTSIMATSQGITGATTLTVNGAPIATLCCGMGFGNEPTNATTKTLSTTLSNTGTAPLNITNAALGGANPADFTIQSTTCGSQLAAGASCTFSCTFSPKALGARSAIFIVSDNAGSGTQSVNMTGTGIPYVTALSVTPPNPTVAIGSTQQFTAIATYSDSSTKDLTTSVNWASSKTSVATMSVTTKGLATAVAAGTATISVNYLGVGNSTVMTVPGPIATLSNGMGFGNTATNATSVRLSTTLSNTGSAVLNITNIGLGGANPGDFAIQSTTCGAQLQPGTNCTIYCTFTPLALGARSATLIVSDNAGTGTQSVNLTGTGIPYVTALSVTPPSPTVAVGNTQQFAAIATYSDGSTKDLTTSVNWASMTTSVATMSSSTKGLATAVAPGTSMIKINYLGVFGSTVMTVQ